MSKLIVVVGVTGNQGKSVAQTFLKEPGWRVRGITRDPSKPSCAPLREAGVELVSANLDSPTELEQAFAGANAIFGVTDFWQFMQNPDAHKEAATRGIPLNVVCYEHEVAQGKNMVDAAAKQLATLDRFVWSTLSDTKKWSKGTITKNYHFDGKAAVTEYLKTAYAALAAKTSYLQVGFYMDNWKMGVMKLLSPEKQPDGTYVMRYLSENTDRKVPFVHPPQDTGPFTRALVLAAPAGKTVICHSNMMTLEEWAALWGQTYGRTCRYEQVPNEAIAKSMPPAILEEVMDSSRYVQIYGWDGGDPGVVTPEQIGVKMDELMKAEDYMRQQDWSQFM